MPYCDLKPDRIPIMDASNASGRNTTNILLIQTTGSAIKTLDRIYRINRMNASNTKYRKTDDYPINTVIRLFNKKTLDRIYRINRMNASNTKYRKTDYYPVNPVINYL